VPSLLETLKTWSTKCGDTLSQLDAQIASIHAAAAKRAAEAAAWEHTHEEAIKAEQNDGGFAAGKKAVLGQRPARFGKRGSNLINSPGAADDEAMELDDEDEEGESKKRASRRKL
jgi:COP9 signalosome complex subunit 7